MKKNPSIRRSTRHRPSTNRSSARARTRGVLQAAGLGLSAIGLAACTILPATASDRSAPAASGVAISADGVAIAYRSVGAGSPALVLIHGGFASQEFWKEQIASLSKDYRIVTLDLAGHGASGRTREEWSMSAYGEDVRSVVDTLELDSVVLVGNSLGGPVALAAAEKLSDRVLGIVAVDTFQDVDQVWPREQMEAYIEALRSNFPATCRGMMGQLLPDDAEVSLASWVEERMCGFPPELAPKIVSPFLDYDALATFAAAEIPIRAILGETIPLDIAGNRALHGDFDAVVLEGCGHYPQLERPAEFDRHLRSFVEEFARSEPNATTRDRPRTEPSGRTLGVAPPRTE